MDNIWQRSCFHNDIIIELGYPSIPSCHFILYHNIIHYHTTSTFPSMSHSTACLTWSFKLNWDPRANLHQLARCFLIRGWHMLTWYLSREFGCWRQAPKSNPPFVFLLPCGQELAHSWKHPHGLPPPSVHDTFSDSAQIQPHPKQIPNPKYKIQKNLTYPEGKRERETYLQGTSQLCQSLKAICRCRPPRVPRMRMAMQRLQPATARLKVSRATRRQRKAIPRRAKVCGAIWHIFFRTTKGRGLSVRRWREQRRRKLKRGWMKIWCIFS